MIKNVEKILRVIGEVVLLLGVTASLAVGIVFLAKGYGVYVPLGLSILIGGGLLSIVSGSQLYGLGELIETSKRIEKNTRAEK